MVALRPTRPRPVPDCTVRYPSYGVPWGTSMADLGAIGQSAYLYAPDGQISVDDSSLFSNAYNDNDLLADVTGIGGGADQLVPPDGQLTVDDVVAFYNAYGDDASNTGRGLLSRTHSRRGYAGYEYDPGLWNASSLINGTIPPRAMWHVRNRVLDSETGRWTRRDPLGYVDGMGLYEYVRSRALAFTDQSGLQTAHPCQAEWDAVKALERRLADMNYDTFDPNWYVNVYQLTKLLADARRRLSDCHHQYGIPPLRPDDLPVPPLPLVPGTSPPAPPAPPAIVPNAPIPVSPQPPITIVNCGLDVEVPPQNGMSCDEQANMNYVRCGACYGPPRTPPTDAQRGCYSRVEEQRARCKAITNPPVPAPAPSPNAPCPKPGGGGGGGGMNPLLPVNPAYSRAA